MNDKLLWVKAQQFARTGYKIRPLPLKRINPSYESPFEIFPVATAVLGIGVVVTLLALLFINLHYSTI